MKRAVTILGLAATLATSAESARAQDQADPYWARPADPSVAERLFPRFAAVLGESGRATVRCRIEEDGHPYLCDVVSEAPQGLGFGAAARVILASAEVGAARVGGEVVPRMIQTMVRFHMEDQHALFGGWTGPEPTPARLKLAREVVSDMIEADRSPRSYRDEMLGGLDYDRRQVVEAWVAELLPRDEAREKDELALHMARLFDEVALRRIRAREQVNWPSEEDYYAAFPEPTAADEAGLEELRRRYCERYECGVDPMATAVEGRGSRMVLRVQDERVFEAPESEAGRATPLIKRVMEQGWGGTGRGVDGAAGGGCEGGGKLGRGALDRPAEPHNPHANIERNPINPIMTPPPAPNEAARFK